MVDEILPCVILGSWGCPYMTSDSKKEGSSKSDFISKGAIIKHLMTGKGAQKRLNII